MLARPVRESRSEYAYVALPNDANPIGNVLGGRVMHLIDMCGGVAAVRHARRPIVTAAIDQVRFVRPAKIGHLLVLKSSVNLDLVYYHERSVDEVAEIVGAPVSTVKTRMFYARKRMGNLLEAAGLDWN